MRIETKRLRLSDAMRELPLDTQCLFFYGGGFAVVFTGGHGPELTEDPNKAYVFSLAHVKGWRSDSDVVLFDEKFPDDMPPAQRLLLIAGSAPPKRTLDYELMERCLKDYGVPMTNENWTDISDLKILTLLISCSSLRSKIDGAKLTELSGIIRTAKAAIRADLEPNKSAINLLGAAKRALNGQEQF